MKLNVPATGATPAPSIQVQARPDACGADFERRFTQLAHEVADSVTRLGLADQVEMLVRQAQQSGAAQLPIHFFTIVLNGEPFIRHHIEEFRKLPFPWHWHIVEGVAELVHDTAWSVQNGGRITDELHCEGRSNDGTSAYLDSLAREFPDQVTVYRKPPGLFWDGKLEMVSAPLGYLNEPCLLWQVDADELWTADQLARLRELFLREPGRSAAYFHCDYFVGPKKYVSSLNTWATYPNDWIRVWNFLPGMRWAAHEPPVLVDPQGNNVGARAPFSRDETRGEGITFQHFAYATEAQVRFKELYYGYSGALECWRRLQQTQGAVHPADYLPWARPDAVVEEWPEAKGALLSERLVADASQAKEYISMSVDGATLFEAELRRLFKEIRPASVIETGTYLGQGTSSIIWRALSDFGIECDFTTIEVNPLHYQLAQQHFTQNGMRINALNGLTLPRHLLPGREEITDKFIRNKEYEGIYYDHDEGVRAEYYFAETDFDVPEDLLAQAMRRSGDRPAFVLLDSAGHLGYAEFLHFMTLVKGDCYLMLDDIYHCKHFKTLQVIKNDPRFEILVESPEKFGFCIARYRHVEKLIFLRPDSIGDNVMAAAMLPHLAAKYPGASITVLCQRHIAELYEACPQVSAVIGFDRLKAYDNEDYRNLVLKQLQGVGADLMLNSLYSREPLYDLFAIGSGARIRVGFQGNLCNIPKESRDQNNQYYSRIIADDPAPKSELERHREFLAALGIEAPPLAPLAWTTPEDEANAEAFFAEKGLDPQRTVALFICGQWGEKIYPHYGQALRELCAREKLTLIALGAPRDAQINQSILEQIGAPSYNLAGGTTLRQGAAILRRCRLAVGADTGTAHLANAVGTPSVVILGGGHFGRFQPYSPLSSIVSLPLACYQCNWTCSFQRAHCMRDLDPEVLATAVREALAQRSSKPRVYFEARELWQPGPGEPAWQDASSQLDRDAVQITVVGRQPACAGVSPLPLRQPEAPAAAGAHHEQRYLRPVAAEGR